MSINQDQLHDKATRLTKFLSLDPTNINLLMELAATYFEAGDTVLCSKTASDALHVDPNIAGAHGYLGLIEWQNGSYSNAAPHLEQAIVLGDPAPILRYYLADCLLRLQRPEDAEVHASIAAQHFDQLPFAPALYVRVLHHLGKMDEALALVDSLDLESNPAIGSANLFGALASASLDADNVDAATDFSIKALEMDSDNIDANTMLGMLAVGDAEPDKGLQYLDKVIGLQPVNGRAWLGKGLGLLLKGDLEAAAKSLDNAASMLDDHLGTLSSLAWTYILSKDPINAAKVAKRAIEKDRTYSEAQGILAVTHLMRGDLDSAQQAVKRAQGLDKDSFSGNLAKGLLQQVSGNAHQARITVENWFNTPVTDDGQKLYELVAKSIAKQNEET